MNGWINDFASSGVPWNLAHVPIRGLQFVRNLWSTFHALWLFARILLWKGERIWALLTMSCSSPSTSLAATVESNCHEPTSSQPTQPKNGQSVLLRRYSCCQIVYAFEQTIENLHRRPLQASAGQVDILEATRIALCRSPFGERQAARVYWEMV